MRNACTRAIRAKADTPDEINQMFDAISYGKAGAVLQMTESYEGAETFRKGVHNYLTAHMFANATAEDFWNAQAEVSHQPVDKILSSFVSEPGVPLLTFGDPVNGRVDVRQDRFFLDPTVKEQSQQTWSIPVCFTTGKQKQQCALLDAAHGSLTVPQGGIFFPDAGGAGYYRYALPDEVYAKIAASVETALTPEERISLLGDEWAGVRANKDSVGDYLKLVAAVRDDENPDVIAALSGPLFTINDHIANTPEQHQALAAWVDYTFKPAYRKLGPPTQSESPGRIGLRAALFDLLGAVGHDPDIIAEARALAERSLSNPGSVEPGLALVATDIAASNGDAALFNELQHTYETASDPQRQEDALRLSRPVPRPGTAAALARICGFGQGAQPGRDLPADDSDARSGDPRAGVELHTGELGQSAGGVHYGDGWLSDRRDWLFLQRGKARRGRAILRFASGGGIEPLVAACEGRYPSLYRTAIRPGAQAGGVGCGGEVN